MVFNVSSYDLLVDANRTHKVAFRPNTVSAPIDLLEEWKLGLHAAGSVGLDNADHFADGPARGDRNQQVDMVFVCIDSYELYLRIMLVDGFDFRHDEGLNAVVDELASVFGWKHNVVVAEIDEVR